jgi:hypothetical protein
MEEPGGSALHGSQEAADLGVEAVGGLHHRCLSRAGRGCRGRGVPPSPGLLASWIARAMVVPVGTLALTVTTAPLPASTLVSLGG